MQNVFCWALKQLVSKRCFSPVISPLGYKSLCLLYKPSFTPYEDEYKPRYYNRRFTVAVSWVRVVGGTLIWRKALIRAFSSIGHPYTKSIKGQILNNCFSCKHLNAIISIIIHSTHYLSSHWLRAYSEFWTSRSREVLSALAFGSAGNT